MKKLFKYLEPLWVGADGKISLRAVLAIFFSWKLVQNLDYGVRKWGADRSLDGLNSLLIILGGLIAALLGIAAWSNMTAKKIDTDASSTSSPIIKVEKVDTISTGTTAETVNAQKVNTVNSTNTNINNNEGSDIPPKSIESTPEG